LSKNINERRYFGKAPKVRGLVVKKRRSKRLLVTESQSSSSDDNEKRANSQKNAKRPKEKGCQKLIKKSAVKSFLEDEKK